MLKSFSIWSEKPESGKKFDTVADTVVYLMLCIFNGINNKTSQKSQKVQLCQLETFKV